MHLPEQLQSHPFTGAQARDAGVTDKMLRRLVSARVVVRLLRGVYCEADLPYDVQLRASALRLVVSRWTLVCDRTAAWLHGVDVFRWAELDLAPPLETCVLPVFNRVRRQECIGRTRDLLPRDIEWLDGNIACTTPLRTTLDLGCLLARREALAAVDAFMRLHDIDRGDLRRELPRFRGRRGVVQLRALVALADPLAESSGESWVRLVLHDYGLPPPVLQHWLSVGGRPTYRLDLAYPRSKVAVEYDGRDFHTSAAQRAADLRRRKWLRDHGWVVIVVTKDDFTAEAIERWTRELRAALFSRAA